MPTLSEDFNIKLLLVSRLLRRELDALLEPYGLSEASVTPIRYLARAQRPLRQNELAEAMGIEGPTLVRLLDQLAKAGYVERVEDVSDRRAKRLHLTPKGEQFHTYLRQQLQLRREILFAGVEEADLRAAVRVFSTVEDKLRQRRWT